MKSLWVLANPRTVNGIAVYDLLKNGEIVPGGEGKGYNENRDLFFALGEPGDWYSEEGNDWAGADYSEVKAAHFARRIAIIDRKINDLDKAIEDADCKMQFRFGDTLHEGDRKKEYYRDWQDYRQQRAALAAERRSLQDAEFVAAIRRVLAAGGSNFEMRVALERTCDSMASGAGSAVSSILHARYDGRDGAQKVAAIHEWADSQTVVA